MNEQVRISPVRLIDHEDTQRGIVPTDEARALARDLGMDLVEISPMERPPVCRIMDYGKFKYDQKKKQKQRSSHVAVLKEVRMRPKTDTNDRVIKMNRAVRFLKEGAKVQFTMLFRGRERAHHNVGLEIFKNIVEELGEDVKLERPARVEGRRMTMVLAPIKPVKPPKPPKAPRPSKTPEPQAEVEVEPPAASAVVVAAQSAPAPVLESEDTPTASPQC